MSNVHQPATENRPIGPQVAHLIATLGIRRTCALLSVSRPTAEKVANGVPVSTGSNLVIRQALYGLGDVR